MELLVISLFCMALMLCIVFNISVLYALVTGLILFCIYGHLKGYRIGQIAHMILSGVKTTKNVLIVLVLIGMLTALWRACGTIPVIICYAAKLIQPKTVIILSFILNCGVSFLTGTSFGTVATMGVICMTMGISMGADPIIVGGAILSGVYFGDRCSPVSTSALLVSELTGTNIFDNIKLMLRTALVPFLITCVVYIGFGLLVHGSTEQTNLTAFFGRELSLHPAALIPAIVILVLSALRVNVKIAMSVSIVSAAVMSVSLQGMNLTEILRLIVTGFEATDPKIAVLLNGGGILSMLNVMAIVCISSMYAGIFQETGLLGAVKRRLVEISQRITPFGGVLITSIVTAMLACNQTLTIMLTHQICSDIETEKGKFAVELENSAVVIAPLIPWSIAGAVPLASAGASMASLFAACFLYLLPVYTLISNLHKVSFIKSRDNSG